LAVTTFYGLAYMCRSDYAAGGYALVSSFVYSGILIHTTILVFPYKIFIKVAGVRIIYLVNI